MSNIITTASIQSMLARNAKEIRVAESLIKACKVSIKFSKEEIRSNEMDDHASKYISMCASDISNCFKEISWGKKHIKTLAAIQRQLKDEIRERKWIDALKRDILRSEQP